MTTITFDTLKFARKLKEAGVPDQQAEAFAEAFRDATSEELVTRDYLDSRLEAIKSDLLKWIAGMLMAQAGLVAALVKLL